jgi:Reverse transcriptase (RNA-dependent DNA polymerase)
MENLNFILVFYRTFCSTFAFFHLLYSFQKLCLDDSSDRCQFQCVVVENCNSEWLPILSGISQQCPLLFIIFIDDIGVICSGSVTHKLFADDIKLYSTIYTNLDNVSLQSALNVLHEWCCKWQLSVKVAKCHVLHIGKSNHHYSNFFSDACVVSDLGIEMDSSLKYDLHINNIVGKAYSRVGVLFKGFYY